MKTALHPSVAASLRAANAPLNPRASIRTELEAEARGLLLAARMHGFTVNLMNGTATVIDTQVAA